jgi:hypothetical protein
VESEPVDDRPLDPKEEQGSDLAVVEGSQQASVAAFE